ncbi:hypothetical protein CUJ84_Chr003724 [Rhizobium leguminosarum]|uniref:Uncharacterized protein n=1 Tax=Rhizobium leguminosarum TaxID=384 RepID=A0A2K9Z726_RHILE|nr:hypothetical protein CUJ84_Chr003724 [Rhizobium leguminosarum]
MSVRSCPTLLIENELALTGDLQTIDQAVVSNHDLVRAAEEIRAFDDPVLCRRLALQWHVLKVIWLFNHHFGWQFRETGDQGPRL